MAILPEEREPIVLNLQEAAFSRRGVDNKELVFSRPDGNEPVITTKDTAILEEIKFLGIYEFDAALKQYNATVWQKRFRRYILPLATLVVLATAILWFVLGPLVDVAVNLTPLSLDRTLGDAAFASSLKEITGNKVIEVKDKEIVENVQKMLNRLSAAREDKRFSFSLYVIEHNMVNAFALPNGKIVLTTGLLKKARSPEEVAGVMSHEMIHIMKRHYLRQIFKKAGIIIMANVVFGDVGTAGDFVLTQATNLTALGFSRSMETESDTEGFLLLKRANLDPSGLHNFLEHLREEPTSTLGKLASSFVSTHPVTSDRLKNLDKLLEKHGKGNPLPLEIDWNSFQETLKKPIPQKINPIEDKEPK